MCDMCNKYGKLKNPYISYIFYKALVLSFICDKCCSKDETIYE